MSLIARDLGGRIRRGSATFTGPPLELLPQDAVRLVTLLEAYQVAVVHIAVLAHRDIKLIAVVVEVRPVFAHVVRDDAGPQHRSRKGVVDRLLRRHRAHALGAADP